MNADQSSVLSPYRSDIFNLNDVGDTKQLWALRFIVAATGSLMNGIASATTSSILPSRIVSSSVLADTDYDIMHSPSLIIVRLWSMKSFRLLWSLELLLLHCRQSTIVLHRSSTNYYAALLNNSRQLALSPCLSLWLKIHALQRRVLKHTYIHTYTHKPKAKPKASWKSHELCFCMYTVFQHTFQSSDIIFSSFSSFSMRLNAFQRCQVLPLVGFTAEVYARIGALFDRWCIWFNWCETWQWNAKHQLYSAPGCMVGLGNPKS